MPPTGDLSQGTSLPSYDLLAANGTPIATYGSHYSVLDLQNGKSSWTFVITDVRQPILGYDFLQYYKMAVGAKDNCLYHATRRIPGTTTNASSPKVSSFQPAGEYTRILQDFPQLTSPRKVTTTRPHNIVHHIQRSWSPPNKNSKTSLTKASSAYRRVRGHRHSTWSPRHLHLPTSGWSAVTIANLTASQRPTAIPSRTPKISISSSPGSKSSPRSTWLGRRSTRFLWYQRTSRRQQSPRRSFGLHNAAQTFQRFMDHALRDFNLVTVYIDDILVASDNHDHHRQHPRLLFRRLQEYGLRTHLSKCLVGVSSLDFFGHRISTAGLYPLPQKATGHHHRLPTANIRQDNAPIPRDCQLLSDSSPMQPPNSHY
ncbi:uncharacterized protein LOC143039247 [Oratosquilla oratoria]|uniref:uncharacterized protein LOC143039247 n=1 Tax=Oratosquilla oratoria TaxID=337810 RepID=UPI003F763D86